MTSTLTGYTVTIPAAAPAVAVGSAAGSMAAGNYNYNVTFVTAFGETTGAASASSVTGVVSSVAVSSIPVSTNGNVFQRKLYRTAQGPGGTFFLLATINDNITTTYTDTLNDTSITGNPTIPASNTAQSRESVAGTFIVSSPVALSVDPAITASTTHSIAGGYPITKEINIVAVAAVSGDALTLPLLNANLVGMHITIVNDGANSIAVYPNTGQTITVNAGTTGGAGAPITVTTTTRTELVAKTSSGWEQIR